MKQTHTDELGTISYRLPSVPESLMLWGLMGVKQKDLKDKDALIHNEFILLSKVIANMGFLIDSVAVKIDDREIKDYEALTKEMAAMTPLCTIAGRVMEALNGGAEERKKP
jgi:hypothetical protein